MWFSDLSSFFSLRFPYPPFLSPSGVSYPVSFFSLVLILPLPSFFPPMLPYPPPWSFFPWISYSPFLLFPCVTYPPSIFSSVLPIHPSFFSSVLPIHPSFFSPVLPIHPSFFSPVLPIPPSFFSPVFSNIYCFYLFAHQYLEHWKQWYKSTGFLDYRIQGYRVTRIQNTGVQGY